MIYWTRGGEERKRKKVKIYNFEAFWGNAAAFKRSVREREMKEKC